MAKTAIKPKPKNILDDYPSCPKFGATWKIVFTFGGRVCTVFTCINAHRPNPDISALFAYTVKYR